MEPGIETLQKKALQLLEPFEKFNGNYNRVNDKEEITKTISYIYVPIDRKTMDKLVALKLQADSIINVDMIPNVDGTDIKPKDAFYYTVKLIKPECTIFNYKRKLVPRYQLITEKEKVLKRLKGEVECQMNIIKKRNRETIQSNDLNEETINKIHNEESDLAADAIKKIKEILDNPNKFDVVITNYSEDLSYPALYINFITPKKKSDRYTVHLREEEIPNVFVYEKPKIKLEHASNAKVKNMIAQGGEHILGSILFNRKVSND